MLVLQGYSVCVTMLQCYSVTVCIVTVREAQLIRMSQSRASAVFKYDFHWTPGQVCNGEICYSAKKNSDIFFFLSSSSTNKYA